MHRVRPFCTRLTLLAAFPACVLQVDEECPPYEEGECDVTEVTAAGYVLRWIGDVAPSGWFGAFKGRTLAAYLGDNLETPEAVAVVRCVSALLRARAAPPS